MPPCDGPMLVRFGGAFVVGRLPKGEGAVVVRFGGAFVVGGWPRIEPIGGKNLPDSFWGSVQYRTTPLLSLVQVSQ